MNFDKTEVKTIAAGRWSDILGQVGGFDSRILDGREHPCPKCDGKDRFRFIDKEAGACLCNQCFNTKNGDGFSAIQWLTGCTFPEALKSVGKYLNIRPISNGRPRIDPARDLKFIEWNDSLVDLWCLKKKPIKPKALKTVGARLAKYKSQFTVIAIPVKSLGASKPKGWNLYNITGGTLPRKVGNKVEQVKVKLTYGSKPGIIGNIKEAHETIWKTEGPSDLLALLSLDLPDNVTAICNANGAKENPSKADFSWLPGLMSNRNYFVVHDADDAGQQGATFVPQTDGTERPGWLPFIANHKDFFGTAKNIVLPYPISANHGKDLRDWITEGNGYKELESLAEKAEKMESGPASDQGVDEAEDDPHRLARVNLARYKLSVDGRLVFWRDEWWRYKDGSYRRIEVNELRAKLTATIRKEFERAWRARRLQDDKPVKKVTRALVTNVIGATESMVAKPASIPMPCWLPDRTRRNFLSFKNGILDLDRFFTDPDNVEDCLFPHTPDWFSAFRLDYDFRPGAEFPKFKEYVEFVTGKDPEKIKLLQEWAGYLLWPHAERQSFLVFEGDGGTGKSSFFAAMAAMVGEDNVSSLSLEDLGEPFGLSSTIGKVANVAGDVGKIAGNEEAILKRYTGGDKVEMKRKFLPSLSLRPTAKMMMAWNERPRFRDKSDGLWRRMILIPLNNQVPKSERKFGMDNPSFWYDEAPAIMLWALRGLTRMIKQNGFSKCTATIKAIQEFRNDANPAREFIEDYIDSCPSFDKKKTGEIDPNIWPETNYLFEFYKEWCRKTNHNPLSDRAFGRQLKKVLPATEKKRRRDQGKLSYHYKNIQLREEGVRKEDDEDEI